MIRVIISVFTALAILWAGASRAEEQRFPSYFELGVTHSSIFHPSIGYWWGRYGVRVSGFYLDEKRHEYHLNIGRVLSDRNNIQRSINLLTSWIVGSDPGADYNYAATGLAYGLNYKGFFFEIGLAVPWRDEIGNLENDPVVPSGYWGYIHRFSL